MDPSYFAEVGLLIPAAAQTYVSLYRIVTLTYSLFKGSINRVFVVFKNEAHISSFERVHLNILNMFNKYLPTT